ncbi:Trk-type K+ transport system, membrane component [Sphingobacterium nematocida]|uniref:Trk-type K+ transport system, membrane component n=1 Tax=Sphingobacterium nematocida TaxID=1513896 RepID=A0A1T5F4N4_9SPHI|nr:potassium transporter TrkG [Sphingobacterium nematocida]SKB91184.1 Trk-type K+ transport system, membrane component [Sphingobacterium nematocida]
MIRKRLFNPAQLFISSFLALILFGTILLKLPIALQQPLSWLDALFTATSAVCVTGLVVVDTATHFTIWGHVFIMLLIQAGGIGILSFAGLFTYFLKGGSSYENQLAIRDFSNTERLGEVFVLLKRTILITFGIELVGAAAIFWSLKGVNNIGFLEKVFTSVFHAVSSFCNAGFSTLPLGLMDSTVLHNYGFQLAVACIYIFGGLGFPIVINVLKYFKHVLNRLLKKWTLNENYYRPWVMTINSKINLITTGLITAIATLVLYINEYGHVLAGHDKVGKWVIAFATATTPRTAGFNSIDFSHLHFSSILFVMLLMWIGASPNSTGGGIKTSTFAVAVLNVWSLARGKNRTDVFRREIATISIQRAFATMFLSLIVIGLAVFGISFFERERPLLDIAFECFSAYSTVGLSLNVTGGLMTGSKVILVLLMFVGRVTMLSVLIAFVKKINYIQYRYAPEELTIY